ncbi:MCE family protein [Mycobacterium sp.]|uniref:MCE family protein n=1 Tax=Mycobacterium sp. TaxID=1785 RepID=UPI002DAC901B|nr:MCE family protein [Mycobacterium sp.]
MAATIAASTLGVAGCEWHGLNSLALPGTAGSGPGAYTVTAQMPNVTNIQPNSRVRVGDVTVGNVTKVELQDWHALVTMRLDGDVELPTNTTAMVGQTSLLGSLHIELAPPVGVPPEGRLHDGSMISLAHAGTYPTTEQTLGAVSLLLNGGGIGQVQDIVKSLATAFGGRVDDLRSLLTQIDQFIANLNNQTDDIIAATESIDNLAGQVAQQKPVIDTALRTLPQALNVLKDQRTKIADALDHLSKFSALATQAVDQTKVSLVQELRDLAPVLKSLADAGPSLIESLGFFSTYPYPKDTLDKWMRGDYGNLTAVLDLTLSRIDAAMFTGTRFEGDLTQLEMQWGRTIGQMPSPYTAGNPLVAPYRFDQGY